MPNFKDFFERLAFAGLKPDAPAGPTTTRKRILIGVGLLAVAGVVVALVIILQKPAERAETVASNAPIVQIAKPGVVVEKNRDLAVESMDFNRNASPKEITGALRNLTDKRFASCEVSFDVTTKTGAQLGGVATTIHDVPPKGIVRFRIVVPQQEAAFAMVRELRPE